MNTGESFQRPSPNRYDTIRDNAVYNPFLRGHLSYAEQRFEYIQKAVEDIPMSKLAPIVTGVGSESLVFVVPQPDALAEDQLRDVVIKVGYQAAERMVESLMTGDNDRAAREKKRMEQAVQTRRRERKELRSYVGSALVREHLFIRDVPVNTEIVREVLHLPQHLKLRFPSHIPAPVTIQPRFEFSEDQKGESWVDVTSQYAEYWFRRAQPAMREEHIRIHDELIGKANVEHHEQSLDDVELFFPSLTPMIDLLRAEQSSSEKSLLKSLQEFVPKLSTYTKEQGIPLDFCGSKNIVLQKRSGAWSFKLIDPFPIERFKIRDLELIIEKMVSRRTDPDDEFELREKQKIAMQILHSVRMINGLAMLAGISDRVEVKGLKDVPAEVWAQGICAVI
jgi:hypothetical protein